MNTKAKELRTAEEIQGEISELQTNGIAKNFDEEVEMINNLLNEWKAEIIASVREGHPVPDTSGGLHLADVTRSYCVKKHMFFAVTNPVIESNLTKEDADKLCNKLNAEELDDTYVHYEVHNCV